MTNSLVCFIHRDPEGYGTVPVIVDHVYTYVNSSSGVSYGPTGYHYVDVASFVASCTARGPDRTWFYPAEQQPQQFHHVPDVHLDARAVFSAVTVSYQFERYGPWTYLSTVACSPLSEYLFRENWRDLLTNSSAQLEASMREMESQILRAGGTARFTLNSVYSPIPLTPEDVIERADKLGIE